VGVFNLVLNFIAARKKWLDSHPDSSFVASHSLFQALISFKIR
jgi:hypothetical protein